MSRYIDLYIDNFKHYGLILGLIVNALLLGATITVVLTIKYIYDCIHNSPEKIGERYEEMVANVVEKNLKIKVLKSLILPCNFIPLGKTETDIVFINRKGIFCCECKHRKFDETNTPLIKYMSNTWILDSQNNVGLVNPFNQNKTHIVSIAENVPLAAKGIYNMVIVNFCWVFSHLGMKYISYQCKGLASLEGEGIVLLKITKSHLFRFTTWLFDPGILAFKKHLEVMPDIYTDSEVDQLYTELKKYEATKKQLKQLKKDQEKLQLEEEYQQYLERERLKDALKKERKNRKRRKAD